ncbi:hypothetical protein GCM10023208_24570 [Erythrobacter westpacificensis]|uniref:Helix-turn-helix domain-containing protein n=1 Tax=Erythrobacter westpacificensis TaxID=1055231 RepID=A0ABP9KGG1_9SPHN
MADGPGKRKKKPRWAAMPERAIMDPALKPLELRCLMVISLHDGMSTVRGNGGGCYARLSTLAEKARTDITNFSKAVKRLIELGYVIREQQQGDKRRFTLRVDFESEDSWCGDQHSDSADNYASIDEPATIVGEDANHAAEIVGHGDRENGRTPPKTTPHYIPLNGELNSDESGELNSDESAHFAFREMRRVGGSRSLGELLQGEKGDPAEAGLSEGEQASIKALLPRSWPDLSTDAQLHHFERAFGKVGRSPELLIPVERQEFASWLFSISDNFAGEAVAYRAERLLDQMEA